MKLSDRFLQWTAGLLLLIGLAGCGGEAPAEAPQVANPYKCGLLQVTKSATSIQKIVNGTTCYTTNTSPVVYLNMVDDTGEVFVCTGTLIAPKKVLTAAHCVDGYVGISVHYGTKEVTSEIKQAVYWEAHASYGGVQTQLEYDVAIVVLGEALPIVTMPVVASRAPSVNETVAIYGFGKISADSGTGILNFGTMQVTTVSDLQIFASYDGTLSNTCEGDSGGPMVGTGEGGVQGVVGITSGGIFKDCGIGDLSSFAKVMSPGILSFIKRLAPDAKYI